MLVTPVHSTIEDVTVFADDSVFWLYYLIPGSPSLRVDDKGNPIFLLVKYAFSDADRQANPALPQGGGYLNFDTTLAVPTATLARITAALQTEVEAEWHRRKSGTADEQASAGVAGTTAPPTVQIDTPTWTAGKVAIDAPQSTALVSERVVEGTPSLLGGATAVFDLDLTPAGADFMQQTLVTTTGTGATDLTPIQVAYDLSFWARLPDVSIVVTADSEKVHDYVRKQLQGRGIDFCTTYDFDHTDITTDTVTSTGLITVQIEQGSGSMPQDALTQLTNYALDLVKQMISSSFFTSTPPAGANAANNPTMPTIDDGTSRKWFLEVYDDTKMHLDLNLRQRSVVTWNVHPQATLESWFQGLSAAQLSSFVRSLDLTDPFFEDLVVTARAFGNYGGDIQSVTVDLQYGPDGPQQKTTSLVFTDTNAQTWSVGLIGTDRSYRYRTTVGYKDHDAGQPSEWLTTSATALTIEALAGSVDVTVLAGDIDFDTVAQVQVALAYEDLQLGVAREEFTVVLTPKVQEAVYQRTIYQPVNQRVQYQTRFTMTSGEVRTDGMWHDLAGPQLVVNQDTTDLLRVNLLPSGNGWADVTKVLVEVRYEDPHNALSRDDTIVLTSAADFKTWTVGLADPTLRSYSYRWTASFANGQLSEHDWTPVTDGSTTVPIVVDRPGIIVTLVPNAIDFRDGRVAEVACHYAQAGIDRQETFVFKDATAQVWTIDAPKGAPVTYTYRTTWATPGATPVVGPLTTATTTTLVLAPLRMLSISVLGQLVDFTATPVVTVSIAYDDAADDLHSTSTCTLSPNTPVVTTEIALADPTATGFTYTITYFSADGAAHPQQPQPATQTTVVVPRLAPVTAPH